MSKGKIGDSKKKLKLKNIKTLKCIMTCEIIIFIMLYSLASNFLREAFAGPIETIEVSFKYEDFEIKGSCRFYESENYSAQDVD